LDTVIKISRCTDALSTWSGKEVYSLKKEINKTKKDFKKDKRGVTLCDNLAICMEFVKKFKQNPSRE